MADSVAGGLVTASLPYAGGERAVTAYVPGAEPRAVVYAGDGQLIAPWGALLESGEVPPTLVVGVHRNDDPDELVRIGEYSPAIEPARFAMHEAFFVHAVGAWVRHRFGVALPPGRTAVCGVSAGAELALALGLRHPDVYGSVLVASPGAGFRPPPDLASPLPRTYLVAGTDEPFFRDNASRWAAALRTAGGQVESVVRTGGHGGPFWAAEFPRMVAWAFAA